MVGCPSFPFPYTDGDYAFDAGVLLLQPLLRFTAHFPLLLSFNRHNNSGGETDASPKGSNLDTPFDVFLSWKLFF
jgi:hypothetical protein